MSTLQRGLTIGRDQDCIAGLIQRVRALNLFLDDVYHDQRILKEKVVPAELVLGSKGYREEMVGFKPPGGVYVHICGTDLIRDVDGQFLVLEDNGRTPSGVSYVLENRAVMKKVFPQLFADIRVKRVEDYIRLQASQEGAGKMEAVEELFGNGCAIGQ